ncbi:pyruvate dehydrogenase E1 component subunit alpha, mitochondrial-like [Drosophila guanche]|uniref:Pyruvate dehydrogenase E1 component subunit alpha n=1 Tax=Drosophila guanche TaxID=7266 RepID=A0A3B0JU78_DROGU|nr:pyruvate dehydrogenase E1 component subunit alpha, mitochondrial-like [Drosophila guanche]SPP79020.1 blast:Probable pyruvate dehydrogenase E1 component subunit alpha%2C mitochondrial [Drosophila guanche]
MFKVAGKISSRLDSRLLLRCSSAQPLAPCVEETVESQSQPLNNASPQELNLGDEYRVVYLPKDFKLHRLNAGPARAVAIMKSQAREYYRQLLTVRLLESAASRLYKEQLVRGFCHLYMGQEACAVGIRAAMRSNDKLITGYRVHGWAYMMGVSARGVLGELTGRRSGCSGGKGGSMHMYGRNFYGGTGIVGDQVPLGAGVALTSKYLQDGGVCLALYGDGAANQGQVFECFNMALLWKLPMIFVCENNNYGMGTSSQRAAANVNYYTRGDLMPGIWVNGQDVLAVRSATEFAIKHAQQEGPIILELCTYRYGGHSMSDPGTSYRTREEIQKVRQQHDPIQGFGALCLEQQILTADELQEISQMARLEMEVATRAARKDGEPPLSHLWSDVYSGVYEGKLSGVHPGIEA